MKGSVGGCTKCEQPIFVCAMCSTANRALARFCRHCRNPLVCPGAGSWASQESELAGGVAGPRQITITRPFWLRPQAYRGYLWCLSVNGDVFRVSPFGAQDVPCGSFTGPGFGKSPFLIAEIAPGSDARTTGPILLAASSSSVKGINLLNGAVREFITVGHDEKILADSGESYCGLQADGHAIYFLKERGGQPLLTRYDLKQDQCHTVSIPAEHAVGPLFIGDRIAIYTKSNLYVLEQGELRPRCNFGNFEAWMLPESRPGLQPPTGREPYVSRGESVYIPGTKNGEYCFLCVSLRGGIYGSVPITFSGDAHYSQDGAGRLLVARAGEIATYEDATAVPVFTDGQLIARGQAYYNAPLAVGFARSGGGGESLRFKLGDRKADYSVTGLGDFIDVGFYEIAGTFVFAYMVARGNGSVMEMKVWEI